jgi:hypothetical protein
VLRQTIRKRLQTKLNEVEAELQRRMHEPIPEQGKWLRAVVGGHFRYYGVPMNQPALTIFGSESVGAGTARCRGGARTAAFLGIACGASSLAGCLCLLSVIPILCGAWASSPKARAGCGRPARPDPWRGCVKNALLGARCCTGDEGRPFEAGLQKQASNSHELLRSKAAVVNVMG